MLPRTGRPHPRRFFGPTQIEELDFWVRVVTNDKKKITSYQPMADWIASKLINTRHKVINFLGVIRTKYHYTVLKKQNRLILNQVIKTLQLSLISFFLLFGKFSFAQEGTLFDKDGVELSYNSELLESKVCQIGEEEPYAIYRWKLTYVVYNNSENTIRLKGFIHPEMDINTLNDASICTPLGSSAWSTYSFTDRVLEPYKDITVIMTVWVTWLSMQEPVWEFGFESLNKTTGNEDNTNYRHSDNYGNNPNPDKVVEKKYTQGVYQDDVRSYSTKPDGTIIPDGNYTMNNKSNLDNQKQTINTNEKKKNQENNIEKYTTPADNDIHAEKEPIVEDTLTNKLKYTYGESPEKIEMRMRADRQRQRNESEDQFMNSTTGELSDLMTQAAQLNFDNDYDDNKLPAYLKLMIGLGSQYIPVSSNFSSVNSYDTTFNSESNTADPICVYLGFTFAAFNTKFVSARICPYLTYGTNAISTINTGDHLSYGGSACLGLGRNFKALIKGEYVKRSGEMLTDFAGEGLNTFGTTNYNYSTVKMGVGLLFIENTGHDMFFEISAYRENVSFLKNLNAKIYSYEAKISFKIAAFSLQFSPNYPQAGVVKYPDNFSQEKENYFSISLYVPIKIF
jgi:hypothetical protein